jgi:hypothetical protein
MAKKKLKEDQLTSVQENIPKELDIKVSFDKEPGFSNRIKIKVILLKNGEEIASDYDFVTLD